MKKDAVASFRLGHQWTTGSPPTKHKETASKREPGQCTSEEVRSGLQRAPHNPLHPHVGSIYLKLSPAIA